MKSANLSTGFPSASNHLRLGMKPQRESPSSHWHVNMSVVKDSWKELDLSFLKETANFNSHIVLTRGPRGENYRYPVSPAGPSLRVTCHKACSRMCIMELAGQPKFRALKATALGRYQAIWCGRMWGGAGRRYLKTSDFLGLRIHSLEGIVNFPQVLHT